LEAPVSNIENAKTFWQRIGFDHTSYQFARAQHWGNLGGRIANKEIIIPLWLVAVVFDLFQ